MPSEEMQYMTSGYPVSTYASNNAGYRMELNGVEQKHSYTTTITTTETAPSGKSFYNGILLPTLDYGSAPYFLIIPSFGMYSVRWFQTSPVDVVYSDGKIIPSVASKTYKYKSAAVSSSSSSYSFSSGTYTFSTSYPISDAPCFVSWDIKDASGKIIYPKGTISSTASVTSTEAFDSSFSSVDYSYFSATDRTLSLTGTPVTGEITGDQTYSFTASNPYVDVELPVSAWVDSVPNSEDFWSFSIDGTLAFDFAVGLQGKVSGLDKSYYALSDLVPSSWQLICNGALVEDTRCSGSFDSVTPTDDGYSASLTMSTGELNLGSVSSGEHGTEPETLGFRIYLTSASGGAETTITNSNTFESVTPYAYISFNDADGNSGLPALTFHENFASGDLSNGDPGDYSVSVNGFGFDYVFYSTVQAAAGKVFYGVHELLTFPVVSGSPYYTLRFIGSIPYVWVSASVPVFDFSSSKVSFGSTYSLYYLNEDSTGWTKMENSSFVSLTDVEYIEFLNYDLKDSSGALLKSAMVPSNIGLSATSMSLTAGGALDKFSPNVGYVSGLGTPISYASAGNTGTAYMFSNNSGEGYVDVTYPAEVFGVLSTEEFLSLVVEGNLALRARVFPAVTDSTGKKFGAPYYIDNPYSVQLIFNDVVFSEEYPLNYITDDDSVASVSGLALHFENFTQLDTITFRLKFQYDSESTEWLSMQDLLAGGDSFTIGADLDILTSPVFDPEYPPGPVVLPVLGSNMCVSGGWINAKLPVYHTASDGYTYYNNFLSPDVVLPDGYSYFILGDFLFGTCIAFTEIPVYGLIGEHGNHFHSPGLPGVFSNGEWVWGTESGTSVSLEHILYSNFDFYDTSGALVMAAGAVKNYGYVHSSGAFDLGNMSTVSVGDRLFTIEGNKFSGDYLGNFVLSHGDEDFYVDVNIPITQFPIVGSLTDYDSVALSGELTLDTALGLLVKTTSGVSRYFISDCVPISVQVLYNGIIVDDYDQEFAISSAHRSYSGFSAGTIPTNFYKDEGYISTNSMPVVGLSSIGFRIHFASPTDSDYQTTHSLTNYHFNSVSSYVRVSFNTVDGENGLPSLVLTRTNTGGNFDDSNLVEWLEKIHTELTTYLPEFSRHFQSMFEEMSVHTDILNEMLVALKDNSAVESVSSTVTNIYNSISNVESTINNVSNTVTSMEQTQQAMQQTQEEMKETQEKMEEDTSALRDVYASEDDIALKENTSDLTSAVIENFFPGPGDDSGDGSGGSGSGSSDGGKLSVSKENIGEVKEVMGQIGSMMDTGFTIGDMFEAMQDDSIIGWFTIEVASDLDTTGYVSAVDDDDPFNMWVYFQQFEILSGMKGDDDDG